MIAPYTADPAAAIAALDRLDGIEAGWVLPGHGQPWTGGVAEADRRGRGGIDLRVRDGPVRDRGTVRGSGGAVAGEVVQRLAVVRDLLGAVITGDDVELAGDAAVGLQLARVLDGEGRPVVRARSRAA